MTVDPAMLDAAASAYVWGYPLVAMHRTRAMHPRDLAREFFVRDRLSTAADRTVVAPNNDTLYSSGWFDLREGDLVVDVDAMDSPERYWSVMLLDAYTNISYVCRRLHGSTGTRARVTYEPTTRPRTDVAMPVVPIATPTVWVLARVLVAGPDDLEAARDAQQRIRVRQIVERPLDPSPRPERAGDFFDELRRALAIDPPAPWHPPLDPAAAQVLYGDLGEESRSEGAREGEARIVANGLGPDRKANGWGTRSQGADFGDDVVYRAAFAKFSLAGHVPAENRTYVRSTTGAESHMLRFPSGGEPPVEAFWSLTLYGPDTFFVENDLGRYSIGDRTPGLVRDADGSLAITIGNERPADPSNWLPAPPGRSFLALRAYEGKPEVVTAAWFPPPLEPVSTMRRR